MAGNKNYHPETLRKTRHIIQRAYPDFIDSEYPEFVAFVEAFFEYLDQKGKPGELIKELQSYRDIDRTVDEFVEYFRREYLVFIPADVLANKVLLVKHIKDFYTSKGTEKAFKFLFRILYNEDIELIYPNEYILRASDGKWVEEKSLKVTSECSIENLESRIIKGGSSGAQALVERAVRYYQQNVLVTELFLSNITGNFIYGETVRVYDENEEVICQEQVYGIYGSVTLGEKGSNYRVNDPFYLRSSGVQIAGGRIKEVTSGRIETLELISGGENYSGSSIIAQLFSSLPLTYVWQGEVIAEQPISNFASQIIGLELTSSNQVTFSAVGDVIEIYENDPDGTGSGAAGIVTQVNDYGEITEISLRRRGSGYIDPKARIISDFGTGAEISVTASSGQIKSVELYDFAIEMESVVADFSGRGNGGATGTPVLATLAEYPGRWINTDGWLDSDKRLQDNYYWQDFSYVVKGNVQISKYRDLIKKLIHPAGLIMFGETSDLFGPYDAKVVIDATPPLERLAINLRIDIFPEPEIYTIYTDELQIYLLENYQINPYEGVGPGDPLIPPLEIDKNVSPRYSATVINTVTLDTTIEITWNYGVSETITFYPSFQILDFGWVAPEYLDVQEIDGSVEITLIGNERTITLDGVRLSDMSMANITANDAGTLAYWEALLTS